MIREREFDQIIEKHITSRARCSRCGEFGHVLDQCKKSLNAPLETPSANGLYRGTLPVRTLPPGASGQAETESRREKILRGVAKPTALFEATKKKKMTKRERYALFVAAKIRIGHEKQAKAAYLSERQRDGKYMKRDKCIRGHYFTENNTYVTKAGIRRCRVCLSRSKKP